MFVCSLSLTMALFIPDISQVFSLTGSTVSAFICFVLPGMFIIKLPDFHGTWTRRGAWALVVAGTAVGVAGTVQSIKDIVS